MYIWKRAKVCTIFFLQTQKWTNNMIFISLSSFFFLSLSLLTCGLPLGWKALYAVKPSPANKAVGGTSESQSRTKIRIELISFFLILFKLFYSGERRWSRHVTRDKKHLLTSSITFIDRLKRINRIFSYEIMERRQFMFTSESKPASDRVWNW